MGSCDESVSNQGREIKIIKDEKIFLFYFFVIVMFLGKRKFYCHKKKKKIDYDLKDRKWEKYFRRFDQGLGSERKWFLQESDFFKRRRRRRRSNWIHIVCL